MRLICHFVVLSLCLFPLQNLFSQCMMHPVPLEERVEHAQFICIGEVIEKIPYFNADSNLIFTSNIIHVKAWLKGGSSTSTICIITQGGFLQTHGQIVHPSLHIEEEHDYLFFLEGEEFTQDNKVLRSTNAMPQYVPFASAQGGIIFQNGLYRDPLSEPLRDEGGMLRRLQQIANLTALTPDGAPYTPRPFEQESQMRSSTISSFSPNPTVAGTVITDEFLVITGTNLGSGGNIFFPNADNGGSNMAATAFPSDYVSWTPSQIVHKVPTFGGSGNFSVNVSGGGSFSSGSPLNISYSFLNVYSMFNGFSVDMRQGYKLINQNGNGGYDYFYNTNFNNNTAAVNAYERALTTWICGTGLNFVPSGTSSINASILDGVNLVHFSSLPTGVIGQATTYYSALATGQCTGFNTIWWLNEFDIAFRTTVGGGGWAFGPSMPAGNQLDFESVALHELGHAHGLGHIINTSAVMHFNINTGATRRDLTASEEAGGNDKMAYSSQLCGIPQGVSGPIIPLLSSACALPVNLLSFDALRIVKNKEQVALDWKVDEYDNDGFLLEKSFDANEFTEFHFEVSQGDGFNHYNFLDNNAGSNGVYYRLWEIDLDGNKKELATRFVAPIRNQLPDLIALPGKQVTLSFPFPGGLTLSIYHLSGKEVYMGKVFDNQTSLNSIPAGIYLYRMETEAETKVGKFYLYD